MADKELIEKLRSQIASCGTSANVRSRAGKNASRARTSSPVNDADAAFKKIVALVNVSDRSEHAIRKRLKQAGFPEGPMEHAIERAKEYGFIDDMRFANVLIRSRLSQGKGVAGIERELRSHNIEPDSVPDWPYGFDVTEESEFDRALIQLERKPPRSKNLRDGAYRKLVAKGYSSTVASAAARTWSERFA